MATVSIVTGANSGIGRATAIHLAEHGHEVYGTVRDTTKATKLQAMAAERGVDVQLVTLDVAEDTSVAEGIAEVLQRAGRVDVLVNNAGVPSVGTVEDTTPAEHLAVMNVNLCGAVRCIRAVLPGMREQGSGAIVNVTSVAGRVGAQAQAAYVASKWAFEGLSEALAFEVAPLGIRVVIVEPGMTRSAIFHKATDVPPTSGAYDHSYRRMFEMYAAGVQHWTDPFEVAAVILEAVTTERPRLRYRCSYAAEEMLGGRARMKDEEWVALGGMADDVAYAARFEELFGFSVIPPSA